MLLELIDFLICFSKVKEICIWWKETFLLRAISYWSTATQKFLAVDIGSLNKGWSPTNMYFWNFKSMLIWWTLTSLGRIVGALESFFCVLAKFDDISLTDKWYLFVVVKYNINFKSANYMDVTGNGNSGEKLRKEFGKKFRNHKYYKSFQMKIYHTIA